MKKIVLALFLAIPLYGWSQAIPNGSFDTWVSNPGEPEVPSEWTPLAFDTVAITKVSAAQAGPFAVKVKAGEFFGFPFPSILLQQFATTTTSRYLNGYFRKTSGVGDTLYISCVYSRDTAGMAAGAQATSRLAAQWTPFSIEIFNAGGGAPDTCSISVIVSGVGSGFELDNLTLSNTPIGAPLGAKARASADGLAIVAYPNPATGDKATLRLSSLSGSGQLHIRMVDMLGKTVWSTSRAVTSSSEQLPISTGSLKKGLYHIVVENAGRRSIVPFVKN